MALDKVVDSAALDAGMTAVADAIRVKAGTTEPLAWPDGFATAISGIETGGGDSAGSVIDKSVVNVTSNAAEVGQYALYGCDRLETASFPEATKIQGGAFVGCKSLVYVSAPNATEIRSDVTNYLFVDMGGNYYKDTIGAFSGCTSLATVDFPAAVTISKNTFSDCINLTTADFPMAVTIGGGAFNGCANLTTANFPMAVTIYQSAFSHCTGLTELKFPHVKTIGESDNDGGGGGLE